MQLKAKQAIQAALAPPPGLVEAVKNKRVVLFLGAGASMEARGVRAAKPPSADQLRADLGRRFLGDPFDGYDLMSVADMAIRQAGQSVVFEAIKTILDPFQPSEAHLLMPRFRWRAIATTNYDLLVERAYGRARQPLQSVVPLVKNIEPVEERMHAERSPVLLLKLHGCVAHLHDETIPLVLSHEHYALHARHRDNLFERLKAWAHESTFVFCGYRLGDAHVRAILHRLEADGTKRPVYYMVAPTMHDQEAEYWASKNVQVLRATFGAFMSGLNAAIPEMWRELDPGAGLEPLSVTPHFRTRADPSPALTSALTKDFRHVHASMPFEPQDARRFYEGYDTGWGAIALGLDVRRHVVTDLLLEALSVDAPSSVHLFLLRSPAGSGKTVSLKRAAWEAAEVLDQLVLWVEDTGALRAEALVELSDLTGKRILVFVDRAAERLAEIERLLSVAQQKGLKLSVIAGERDNEWNVYAGRLNERWTPRELRIGRLSATEIGGLVDLLARHHSLGLLEGATREERVAAFLERADRQLLVALHEATRGRPFEEIVHDEYAHIVPERAQRLYLDICTLNQFGAPVRAGTIARASGIHFEEFKDKLFAPLEGVVLVEQDRYSGDMGYRARHARVAELVFRQACPDDEVRVEHLTRLAGCLDIGYSADRQAFERIGRGRGLRDLVASADAGRRIYRALLRISPGDAFLHQQWAIFEMLAPGGDMVESERLVDEAARLNPASRSIAHTQAEVARRRAAAEGSPIAKERYRRMARQRLGRAGQPTDKLVLSTRCKLLVDEVEDLVENTPDAADEASAAALADKVKETEDVLRQAQQLYSTDADLLETEARLRDLLGQRERAVRMLERAWRAQPRGSGVALRLSKLYAARGNAAHAKSILEEALGRSPDDKGVHLELAKVVLREGDDQSGRAGEHLARSHAKGDKNFDARHLHAQYLFKVGRAKEARQLFLEIDRDAPPAFLAGSGLHNTVVSDGLGWFSGRVARKDATYLFIRSAAYPDDIYGNERNSDEDQWRPLASGADVQFRVKFGRKGPVACDVQRKVA